MTSSQTYILVVAITGHLAHFIYIGRKYDGIGRSDEFRKREKETLLERCFNVAVPASVAPRVDYYAFDLGALKTVLSSYYLFEK